MNIFLDSSALIKIYHNEEGSRNLVDFLHSASGDLFLTIAEISALEFRSALFKKVRSNEIPEQLVMGSTIRI